MSDLLAAMGLVSVDGHVPQNGDAVLLGDSLGIMLIPSFLHLNARHLCRPSSACVQLPFCGGGCIQF